MMKAKAILASIMLVGGIGGITIVNAGVESADAAKVQAGSYQIDPSHVSVAARIDHLGFTKTTVRFAKIAGSFDYDPATAES